MEFKLINVEMPSNCKDCNIILGQSHFIKTIEDLYETLMESSPHIKFGIAFCEASGKRLIRSDGNDEQLIRHAEKEALKIGAGHSFIIFLKNSYPINVLNRIKNVSEVAHIFAATANPLKIVVAEEEESRGILGVLDGLKPLGIETELDKKERREFLRKIGYKK